MAVLRWSSLDWTLWMIPTHHQAPTLITFQVRHGLGKSVCGTEDISVWRFQENYSKLWDGRHRSKDKSSLVQGAIRSFGPGADIAGWGEVGQVPLKEGQNLIYPITTTKQFQIKLSPINKIEDTQEMLGTGTWTNMHWKETHREGQVTRPRWDWSGQSRQCRETKCEVRQKETVASFLVFREVPNWRSGDNKHLTIAMERHH